MEQNTSTGVMFQFFAQQQSMNCKTKIQPATRHTL